MNALEADDRLGHGIALYVGNNAFDFHAFINELRRVETS